MSAQNDLVNPLAVIGDNHPPETISSIIAAENADKEIAAADKWGSLAAVTDAEQAISAQDAIDRLTDIWNKYEDERVAEKKPFDDGAKAVQKRWVPILDKIEACLVPIRKLRSAWLDAEDARLAKERQEKREAAEKAARQAEGAARKAEQATQSPVSAKLAAEAAAAVAKKAAQAAAAVPDRAQTKGSYGRPARSLRTVWFGEIVDVIKAARHYRERPELIEALTKLVSADARGGLRDQPGRPAVPGCLIKSKKE